MRKENKIVKSTSPVLDISSVMERFDTNIFLSFYLFFLILYFFSFEFLFFLVTRKRHVTPQSHDMSHGVMSQA